MKQYAYGSVIHVPNALNSHPVFWTGISRPERVDFFFNNSATGSHHYFVDRVTDPSTFSTWTEFERHHKAAFVERVQELVARVGS